MPYWLIRSPVAIAAITASGSIDTPSASADQRSTGLFASSSGAVPDHRIGQHQRADHARQQDRRGRLGRFPQSVQTGERQRDDEQQQRRAQHRREHAQHRRHHALEQPHDVIAGRATCRAPRRTPPPMISALDQPFSSRSCRKVMPISANSSPTAATVSTTKCRRTPSTRTTARRWSRHGRGPACTGRTPALRRARPGTAAPRSRSPAPGSPRSTSTVRWAGCSTTRSAPRCSPSASGERDRPARSARARARTRTPAPRPPIPVASAVAPRADRRVELAVPVGALDQLLDRVSAASSADQRSGAPAVAASRAASASSSTCRSSVIALPRFCRNSTPRYRRLQALHRSCTEITTRR